MEHAESSMPRMDSRREALSAEPQSSIVPQPPCVHSKRRQPSTCNHSHTTGRSLWTCLALGAVVACGTTVEVSATASRRLDRPNAVEHVLLRTTRSAPQQQQQQPSAHHHIPPRSLEDTDEDVPDDDDYYQKQYYGNEQDVADDDDDYYSVDDDGKYAKNNNDDHGDDAVATNDDAAANSDTNDDDGNDDDDDDYSASLGGNKLCTQFLLKFLEGTTDAHDECEGIMNAYTAAECSSLNFDDTHDSDDYFENFSEHECCQALQSHHSGYCEEDNLLSNFHLFVAAAVLLLCECAKAVVFHTGLHGLPEAAVCILVGTCMGLFAHFLPMTSLEDLSFDDELFLQLLLPPIIFEAALSVSKFEFKRRRGAIFMFSVFGTVISTFTTGLMVHYASKLSSATTFPMLDSLVFGALISSIDPVAILSVLTSLNMDQKDTVFILVFGESLLNDGIAITVFETLVSRFDGKTKDSTTSMDEIFDAMATFLIAMFGSIAVGLACGCGAWVYFNFLGHRLQPVMEVGSFFLWALIPYYICDGVGWSGIVSIVVVGFFMDIYIAGPKFDSSHDNSSKTSTVSSSQQASSMVATNARQAMQRDYVDMGDEDDYYGEEDDNNTLPTARSARSMGPLPSTERIHLSATADRHVRFVAHLTSQLAENAIFAYLGLFLFSNNYDWNPTLISIGIVSCVLSRTLMVVVVAFLIFNIYKCRGVGPTGLNSSRTAAAIQDKRTQAVLVLAGLRGAVSLALVENVPIYNNVTGEGCEFKQIMKGMTSACILFTTFVFGGGAYYVLPHLGIFPDEGDRVSVVASLSPVTRAQASSNHSRRMLGEAA